MENKKKEFKKIEIEVIEFDKKDEIATAVSGLSGEDAEGINPLDD